MQGGKTADEGAFPGDSSAHRCRMLIPVAGHLPSSGTAGARVLPLSMAFQGKRLSEVTGAVS